jgi:hypothetical protein
MVARRGVLFAADTQKYFRGAETSKRVSDTAASGAAPVYSLHGQKNNPEKVRRGAGYRTVKPAAVLSIIR